MGPSCSDRRKSDSNLRMFVLDVLRHDVEELSSIVKMLNNRGCIGWREFWPDDFTSDEVGVALEALLSDGLVTALAYDVDQSSLVRVSEYVDVRGSSKIWYELNPKGRALWESWDPPK